MSTGPAIRQLRGARTWESIDEARFEAECSGEGRSGEVDREASGGQQVSVCNPHRQPERAEYRRREVPCRDRSRLHTARRFHRLQIHGGRMKEYSFDIQVRKPTDETSRSY